MQKLLLNKLFDDGLRSGNKITAEKAEKRMRKEFVPEDYLPVTTIKSYFARRAAKKKKTKEKSMKKMKIQMKMMKVIVKLRVKIKHLIQRKKKSWKKKEKC